MHTPLFKHSTVPAAAALFLVFSSGTGFAQSLAEGVTALPGAQCGGLSLPVTYDIAPTPPAEGTMDVTSAFGDVELPVAPGAALGMYTTDVDMLIWLGYPLAQSQPIRGDNNYVTFPCYFPQAALEGRQTFGNYPEYNFEQILLAEPDFILNGLGYDADVNARLPQIAPTYSLDAFDGIKSWQQHFEETAERLGRPERYDAWLAVYEARLAEVRANLGDNAGVVVAPFGYWGGVYASSCYVGVECTVFRDLGLTIYEPALADNGTGIELAAEEVGQLAGVDYVFTGISVDEAGLAAHAEQMAEAAQNPLWANLEFVQAGHVIPYELEMSFGSPSGQLAFLEVVAAALGQ